MAHAYLERGLEGVQPRTAPGPAPTLTEDLAPALRQWVIDGPAACGLDRANWTYPELADYLFSKRGIRVQKSAMQVFCHKHGISARTDPPTGSLVAIPSSKPARATNWRP